MTVIHQLVAVIVLCTLRTHHVTLFTSRTNLSRSSVFRLVAPVTLDRPDDVPCTLCEHREVIDCE